MENRELVNEFDKRHAAAVHRWQRASEMTLKGEPRERHVIEANAGHGETQEIDSLLIRGDDSTLIVPLQGALGRNMETPRFEWVRALRDRPETRLFISDAALSAERNLYMSWYFGTHHDDVQERTARYIEHVSQQIGATKIVLFGHSGGGYAAIAIGQKIKGSVALAYNPTVHLDRSPNCTPFMKQVFGHGTTFAELDETFPNRTNLTNVLHAKELNERVIVVQNDEDEKYFVHHFGSLANHLGLPAVGGTLDNGTVQLVVEKHGSGHIAPPVDSVNAWLDRLAS